MKTLNHHNALFQHNLDIYSTSTYGETNSLYLQLDPFVAE
jgi:hypothetical protein